MSMKRKLPSIIPIFPLSGVIYFPKVNLPLNIFEPKYLALVNDCMITEKYMGIIQFKKNNSDIYSVGCLGKITENKKTKDGRVLINLTGISRFEIKNEINNDKHYREFEVSYAKFEDDLKLKDQLKKTEKFEKLSDFSDFSDFSDVRMYVRMYECTNVVQRRTTSYNVVQRRTMLQ